MKKWLCMLCLALIAVTGCGSKEDGNKGELIQFEAPKSGDIIATMNTTMGDIKLHLFPKEAPKAVENFVTHAKEGYYDNLSFHRVIQNFMIQGGDPKGNGTGGESIWGSPFEDEFSDQLYNFNGALSMANAGKNTNGSQFFIVQNSDGSSLNDAYFKQIYAQAKSQNWGNAGYVHPDNAKAKYQEVGGTPHLDHQHTVFGQVMEGMDVVEAIAKVKTDANNHPLEDVLIKSIAIEEVK